MAFMLKSFRSRALNFKLSHINSVRGSRNAVCEALSASQGQSIEPSAPGLGLLNTKSGVPVSEMKSSERRDVCNDLPPDRMRRVNSMLSMKRDGCNAVPRDRMRRVNSMQSLRNNPGRFVSTRTKVTFPGRVVYPIVCYVCKAELFTGSSLIKHFEADHPAILVEAEHLKLVCRCGSAYTDEDLFEEHKKVCPSLFWHKPPDDFVKVTTDGCCKIDGEKGPSACGGIVRDCTGDSLAVFRNPLGICNPTLAELIALNQGLDIVNLGIHRKAILELDSKNVIGALKKTASKFPKDALNHILSMPDNEVYKKLLLQTKTTLEESDVEFIVRPIFREANEVADCLAKLGLHEDEFRIQSYAELLNSCEKSYLHEAKLLKQGFRVPPRLLSGTFSEICQFIEGERKATYVDESKPTYDDES